MKITLIIEGNELITFINKKQSIRQIIDDIVNYKYYCVDKNHFVNTNKIIRIICEENKTNKGDGK